MVKKLEKVDHVLRGNTFITSKYKRALNLRAIITSMLDCMGDVEDQVDLFQSYLPLQLAQGDLLDYWGEIFNAQGRPEDDNLYRSKIFAYMTMYRSEGTATDIRSALLAGFIASETFVWDTDPAKYTAQVYNPTYPVDTVLLQKIVDTASANGVGTTGVTAIPAQYGYFGFDSPNVPTDAIPPFGRWTTYHYNSGKYSPQGNGYRIYCASDVSTDVNLSFVTDDGDFYNELLAGADTSYLPYNYTFFSGALGTQNNRIRKNTSSSSARLDFFMPIGEATNKFITQLKNAFTPDTDIPDLASLTIYDKNNVKFYIECNVKSSNAVRVQTQTSGGVDIQKVELFLKRSNTTYSNLYINDNGEDVDLLSNFANYTRNDQNLFNLNNPNGLATGVLQVDSSEGVFFEDSKSVTWGIGSGTPFNKTGLGTGEWEVVNFQLATTTPAFATDVVFDINTAIGPDQTVLGTYSDTTGSGIVFTYYNDTAGSAAHAIMMSRQIINYYSSDGRPVTLLVPGSTIGAIANSVTFGGLVQSKVKLFEPSGERVESALCYGNLEFPDGFANASAGYTGSEGSKDNFALVNTGNIIKTDDTSILYTSKSVTRNQNRSHALELQATMPIYTRDNEIDFETRNPWGLLKSYYNFSALDPKPMVKGTFQYTAYHGINDASFDFLSRSVTNYGTRITNSFSPTNGGSIIFMVEDNERGREFLAQLYNEFVVQRGGIRFNDSNGDEWFFKSVAESYINITAADSTEYSVPRLTIYVYYTDGDGNVLIERYLNDVIENNLETWVWSNWQEFDWPIVNPDGIRLEIGSTEGGTPYITGEDVGHYSQKFGQPQAPQDVFDTPYNYQWGSLEEQGIDAVYKTLGYQVFDGKAEFPVREIENAWKFNTAKWLDYLIQYGTEQDTAIEQANERLDNLSATEVVHLEATTNPVDVKLNLVDDVNNISSGIDVLAPNAQSLSGTLVIKPFERRLFGDEPVGTASGSPREISITDQYIEKQSFNSSTHIACHKGSALLNPQIDWSEYDQNGNKQASLLSEYIVQANIEGFYTKQVNFDEITIPRAGGLNGYTNELNVFKRVQQGGVDVSEVELECTHTLDLNNYYTNFADNEPNVPLRGVTAWTKLDNKVFFTVSFIPTIWLSFVNEYVFPTNADGIIDFYEWNLDTGVVTLIDSSDLYFLDQRFNEQEYWNKYWNNLNTPCNTVSLVATDQLVVFSHNYGSVRIADLAYRSQVFYVNHKYPVERPIRSLDQTWDSDSTQYGWYPNVEWIDSKLIPMPGYGASDRLETGEQRRYFFLQLVMSPESDNNPTLFNRIIEIDTFPSFMKLEWQDWKSVSYGGGGYPGEFNSSPYFTGGYECYGQRIFLGIGYDDTEKYDQNGFKINQFQFNNNLYYNNIVIWDPFLKNLKYNTYISTNFKNLNYNSDANYSAMPVPVGIHSLCIIPYTSRTSFQDSFDKVQFLVTSGGNVGLNSDSSSIESDFNCYYLIEIELTETFQVYRANIRSTFNNSVLGSFTDHTSNNAEQVRTSTPYVKYQAGIQTIEQMPNLTLARKQLIDFEQFEFGFGRFYKALSGNQYNSEYIIPVDLSGVPGADNRSANFDLTPLLTPLAALNTDGNTSNWQMEYSIDGAAYDGTNVVGATDSIEIDITQTLELKLSGYSDLYKIAVDQELYVYSPNNVVPTITIADSAVKTPINGLKVSEALDLLYTLSPTIGYDVSYNFLGGLVSLPAFDNLVESISGGDPTYTAENLSLVASVPFTVNHNLGHKLVITTFYSSLNGVSQEYQVNLIDDNSLTITSSADATVSIIVKA